MKRRFAVRKLGRVAEKAFLAGLFALMTHYAATKNAGVDGRGGAAAERDDAAALRAVPVPVVGSASCGAYAHDLAPGETFGPLALPTGFTSVAELSFFDFAPSPTGVWLGAAWPPGHRPGSGVFDVWGNWRLAPDGWSRIASVDAADAARNFAALVDWPTARRERVRDGLWPWGADGSAGFFRLRPREASAADTDGDGLTDLEERGTFRTDPYRADTDGDGDDDGWEVERGFDPLSDEGGIGPEPMAMRRIFASPLDWAFFTDVAVACPYGPTEDGGSGPLRGFVYGSGPPTLTLTPLPQLSGGYTDDVFGLDYLATFRPLTSGVYAFSIAADDEGAFALGPSVVEVTWRTDHGNARTNAVSLAGGDAVSVDIAYENSGAQWCGLETALTAGDPVLELDRHVVEVAYDARATFGSLAPKVTLAGGCDPFADYEVAVDVTPGLEAEGGTPLARPGEVAEVDLRVFPDMGWEGWRTATNAVALYSLLKDGAVISTQLCTFVSAKVEEEECGCCEEGTSCRSGCVEFSQAFGRTPGVAGLPTGRLVVLATHPGAALGSPAALRYDHPAMRRLVRRRNLDAVVLDGLGRPAEYRRGLPAGCSSGGAGQFFRAADGAFVEELPDGLRVVYDGAGAVAALWPRNGGRVAVADLGIVVARDASGAISSVACPADGRLGAERTGARAWRLVWTSPAGATVKAFDFAYDGSSVFTLRETRGAAFAFDFRWTYDESLNDWRLERGADSADVLSEEKSTRYDASAGAWTVVSSRLGAGGAVASESRVLRRDRHVARETERRDAVTGRLLRSAELDARGRVVSETDALGATTAYAYDAAGRVTRETTVAPGVPVREVETAYADGVAPYEMRPAARRTYLGGELLLAEFFSYGTNAAGGATAVRSRAVPGGTPRVSYEEYDACARLTLTVREDGRATRVAYGEWGGGVGGDGVRRETEDEGVIEGWGEIVAGMTVGRVAPRPPNGQVNLAFELSSLATRFALVPGKSTREIRVVNAQGDVIRRESYALPLNSSTFQLLNHSTAAYSPTHKPTFTSHSDGTTEAADWICPGPVWQTGRDGVTVSNEYGGAKLLAATTRYGAFGPVTTRYDRDAAGRIIRETTVAPNCETQTVTRTYDSRGRVTGETDAQGRTTTTSYSDDDRVTTTTYADGGTRIVTRNADGTLASITGTTVTPEYHTYGIEVIDAGGTMVGRGLRSAPSGCDETGQGDTTVGRGVLTAPQPYPNGSSLPVGFGANGNLSMPVRVHEIRYGRADSPRFTRTYTDGFGDVIREERSGANGATLVTENAYNAFGRLVATAETAKPLVEYAYDEWGDRVAQAQSTDDEWRLAETETASVVADDGEVWRETTATRSCSDAAIAPLVTAQRTRLSGLTLATNAVTITTDVRGNETVTTATIDPETQSSFETTVAPGILNVATNWYTDGVMVSNISHSGVQTQIRRDTLRRETARIDGRGNVTRTEYDALGRVAVTIDALTNATTYAYDPMNRVAAITNALGDATIYEYDHRGNKTYEGGATYPVRYTYDVYGNKTTMTTYRHEPDGGVGHAALPTTGDTTVGRGVLTAPPGDTTTWLYDEASGVMTNKVYADGKGPSYTYTDDGKLASRTWARGIVTTYAYDGWGNLINTSYSDDTPTVTVDYDALGRQVEAHDAAGVTTFAYDAYGANTNETVIGVAGTNTIERFTDAYGRDAGYALNGARQTILGYDEQTGRLATMQVNSTANGRAGVPPPAADGGGTPSLPEDASTCLFRWTYLPGSDLKSQLAYPNGLTASWTYDANNQLLQVRNATPTNVISQYDYAYDAAGRRIACARSGAAMSVADTIAYAYNARGELTNAVSDVDANYAYSYQYDDIGNRLASCERGTNTIYTANELNQYTSIVGGPAASEPEFDDDGNQTLIRTATGEWRVTYNGENRPILWEQIEQSEQSNNRTILTMSYDRMGRRVVKNDERFVYNGYLQVANFQSPTQTQNSNYFIWYPTEPVATRPLFMQTCAPGQNFKNYSYTHDGNKNVTDVISCQSATCTVMHYDYAPFGAERNSLETTVELRNPMMFSSEYRDESLGLYCYLDRHYDPMFSRWLCRDLIAEDGGINLFAFCANDAVNHFDIRGRGWTFSPVTFGEKSRELHYSVSYAMDEAEKRCCSKVRVDRYVRKLFGCGGRLGSYVLDHASYGSYYKGNDFTTAYAEPDSPAGPGCDYFRIPWTQRFKWVAVCEEGCLSGKILSEVEKDFRTSGMWGELAEYGGEFLEPRSPIPIIMPPVIFF